MAYQAVDIVCPGCGAPATTGMETCSYCQRPIVITSFATVSSVPQLDIGKYVRSYEKVLDENPQDPIINKALGLCYLARGNYDRVKRALEYAIDSNPDDADAYYFAAIAMLKGKKAFLASRTDIDKIVEYAQTAAQIGSDQDLPQTGTYYYFLSYVTFDYFKRKHLSIYPSYDEYLAQAGALGVTQADADELHSILKTPRPNELA